MINKEKLAINLKELKKRIPSKPKEYTAEHPKKIGEALKFYCNHRTVNGVQACTTNLNDDNWPLPLWFDPENVKVGFCNNFYYKKQYNSWPKARKKRPLKEFQFFSVLIITHFFFKRSYDEIILEAFGANKKFAFHKLLSYPILISKTTVLKSIRRSFKDGNWTACICTLFPLIDFVTRKFLRTKHLSVDVHKICKLFAENGFSIETANELMPHFTSVLSGEQGKPFFSKERDEWMQKMEETDFGLIGPALSSFIRFANIYYSFYKEDVETDNPLLLNRHAILHGSINNYGTKTNTVKLITFLILMLELEPVFEILFTT